jgi:hypothetical protein
MQKAREPLYRDFGPTLLSEQEETASAAPRAKGSLRRAGADGHVHPRLAGGPELGGDGADRPHRRRDEHSIRINDQYRICFRWTESGSDEVEIVDYH